MIHYDRPIPGWCNFHELYKEMVDSAPQYGAHFVELGVFKGASTATMCSFIHDSAKNIKFDAIDWFKGSPEHRHYTGIFPDDVKTDDEIEQYLYEEAKLNLKPAIDLGLVNLIKKSVKESASDYATESLDFVFHDASHECVDLVEEIPLWWTKVKPGGYFAGHDYLNTQFYPCIVNSVNRLAADNKLHITLRVMEDVWVIKKPND